MGGLSDAISRAFGAKPGIDAKVNDTTKTEQTKKKE